MQKQKGICYKIVLQCAMSASLGGYTTEVHQLLVKVPTMIYWLSLKR